MEMFCYWLTQVLLGKMAGKMDKQNAQSTRLPSLTIPQDFYCETKAS